MNYVVVQAPGTLTWVNIILGTSFLFLAVHLKACVTQFTGAVSSKGQIVGDYPWVWKGKFLGWLLMTLSCGGTASETVFLASQKPLVIPIKAHGLQPFPWQQPVCSAVQVRSGAVFLPGNPLVAWMTGMSVLDEWTVSMDGMWKGCHGKILLGLADATLNRGFPA